MALKLTPSGMDLLLRTIAGEATIDFTAIQLGNGADAGESAVALSNPLLTVEISSYDVGDIFVTLTSTFSNQTVSAGFRATELGVLAKDPDDPERTLLYAYAYTPDDQADYIPASADKVLETQLDVLVYIGDAENVTASISQSLVYASKAEFDAFVARRDNPHQVSKEQVGLGNVPNVSTNDQTPIYTTPAAPEALTSGETLGTAMGKIARAVLSLISHLADRGNPHKVTADQTGAAAASHKHSATDITSGLLSLERGGTGGLKNFVLADSVQASMPSSQRWTISCFGRHTFVAITTSGIAAYSRDGVTWVQTSIPSARWRSVCYGNGKFVAIADGTTAAYSWDGITWVQATLPDGQWRSVCYGNGRYVAVAFNDISAYSDDGINWTKTDLPSGKSNGWMQVCYGNGKFVAVGRSDKTVYSSDGATWDEISDEFQAIYFGNGRFFAYTPVLFGNEDIYSSEDGITWVQTATDQILGPDCWFLGDIFLSIAYVDNSLGFNSDNSVRYSYDGAHWQYTGIPQAKYCEPCYGDGIFILPQAESDKLLLSKDGKTWVEEIIKFKTLDNKPLGSVLW